MDIKNSVSYVIIISALINVISILLQVRGSGLGSVFGSMGGDFYRSRRGVEKFMFNITIVTAIIFIASCMAAVLVNR